MEQKYDCTLDVLKHRARVEFWMDFIAGDVLRVRARRHDESKLHSPEKEIFDEFTPKLKTLEFGSDEYRAALEKMGDGLKAHYKKNSHHPEHFQNGIDGMSLTDLIEMVADWMAAASVKNASIDMEYLKERFNLSDQLANIIQNTFFEADMDAINFRIPDDVMQIHNFGGSRKDVNET